MGMTFLDLAEKVLREVNKPMSNSEIWEYAEGMGYVRLLDSSGKTPKNSLSASLTVEMRNVNSKFILSGNNPRRFSLKSTPTVGPVLTEPVDDEHEEEHQITQNFLEIDLHPVLAYFASTFLNIHLKTINHSKSGKRTYGEWVHPDMVGCYFPFETWQSLIVDINSIAGGAAIKLYSFELKKTLSFSNLRESFFQAVSNSSWANEGYLVAENISSDLEFQDELKRLTSAFGIGVIKLDIEDPDASIIMYPSREKEQIDWETVNKLASMNSDFEKFLVRVKRDHQTRDIIKERYDKILSREQIIEKFKPFLK